ncbi:MAG: 50S ribosomal protein L18 [Nanoarchaeota archaeon]|nr:50S ribosomal protein L18 [Nanoarchaeota archaeon]
MKKSKNYTVKFKRKRKSKTDYKKRLELLKSKKPRIVIRKSSKTITSQLINYETKGDKTLLLIKSSNLKVLGWKYNTKNSSSAYLTGLLLGTKAKKLNINEAIVDFGLQRLTKNSVLYATVNGIIDGGLKVPHNKKIIVPKERILGLHINKDIQKNFEEVKNKILKND